MGWVGWSREALCVRECVYCSIELNRSRRCVVLCCGGHSPSLPSNTPPPAPSASPVLSSSQLISLEVDTIRSWRSGGFIARMNSSGPVLRGRGYHRLIGRDNRLGLGLGLG